MIGPFRGASIEKRAPLNGRWALCATPAGMVSEPSAFADAVDIEWLPIDRPDTVAGALRRAGRWSIDAPPKRFDAEDWWFRAVFDPPPKSTRAPYRLAFDGLAGECQVWLNGAALLTSDNMYVAHECPVSLPAKSENELLIRFASLDSRLARRRPRPRWRAPMVEHQQLRWARVSLLGRTPGWSPPIPAIGPWRAVEWVESADINLSSVRLRSELDGNVGRVALSVELTTLNEADHIVEAMLVVSRDGVSHRAAAVPVDEAGTLVMATLAIPEATRWWPHTHGDPALYDAMLVVKFANALDAVSVDLGRLGFRTLKVDTTDGDFALRVNDVLVFCRGANWTPLDVVSPATSPEASRAALAQMQAAGLNMVRVNGCMVYEDDAFYQACDALGLLIWQDFMFANMDYPANDECFAASVEEEVRQHLARWRAHPSLAVICGNSEVEQQAAMWGAPRDQWFQPLFDDRLAALAREYCPDVTYWPSSAHGGAFPHQSNVGTTSYYGVGAYLRPMDDARRSGLRFASECLAFANVPPPATIARMPGGASLRTHHPTWKARSPRDLGAGWDFEDVRDDYLRRLFCVDPVVLRSTDHERYLQLSRAVSAEVIEITISEWRRPSSSCRGALVWFLRDLWAGAGWGLLDEGGTPKAAFHGLRRASAPVHLFLTDEGTNGLALHVVNDPATPLIASVEVALFREDGLRLQSSSREVSVPAHGGQSWPIGAWFDSFVDASRAYRFGPSEHALVAATLRNAAGRPLDRAFFFPQGLPVDRRQEVGLKIEEIERHAKGAVTVAISARSFAQSVYFDAGGYVADDEHFHLAPGETWNVCLNPIEGVAAPATRVSVLAVNARSGATLEIPR